MIDNFNVGTPIKENIDFAFKNLLFYVNASIEMNIYSEYKQSFEQVLAKIKEVLSTYVNNENLASISEDLLQDIKFNLIDLDVETKNLRSYFVEWSLVWLEAIISLRMSEIKMGGVNNES